MVIPSAWREDRSLFTSALWMFDRLLTGSMLCGIVTRFHRAFTGECYCIIQSVCRDILHRVHTGFHNGATSVDIPLFATTKNNNACVVIVLITITSRSSEFARKTLFFIGPIPKPRAGCSSHSRGTIKNKILSDTWKVVMNNRAERGRRPKRYFLHVFNSLSVRSFVNINIMKAEKVIILFNFKMLPLKLHVLSIFKSNCKYILSGFLTLK